MKSNQYQWNDCGVCTNPTIAREWNRKDHNSFGYYVRIKVAQLNNGKWCFGYDYAYNTGGGGCPCSSGYKGKEVFNTFDEAERTAIQHLYDYFKDYWATRDCLDMLGKLKEWLQPKQLSLFEL